MKRLCKLIMLLVATFGLVLPALAQTSVTGGPRFTNIHLTNIPPSSVSLMLTGTVMTTYTIQATSDLGKSYSTVGTVITDVTGKGSFMDVGTLAVNTRRFYRAQQFP